MMDNVLKHNLYDNYKMVHPNGDIMCRVNLKKANWYVSRNLAVWENEDAIRLTFSPNGRGRADDPFFMQKFKNHCVVCGSTEELTRHHVVPYVFRQTFPEELKAHDHYDVLLVCHDCHESYERQAFEYKNELCIEMTGMSTQDHERHAPITKEMRLIRKARSFMELLENPKLKGKMTPPPEKVAAMANLAAQPLPETTPFVAGCKWGSAMMSNFHTIEDYENFSVLWRKHFLKTMNPQYLPDHWTAERERTP